LFTSIVSGSAAQISATRSTSSVFERSATTVRTFTSGCASAKFANRSARLPTMTRS
jgi:hypothetical protein